MDNSTLSGQSCYDKIVENNNVSYKDDNLLQQIGY